MMSDLITTGTIDLPQAERRTLVADQITAYLEQHEKTVNDDVLAWMMDAFKRKVLKQLMSTRDTRKGHDSCTMYSGPCAVKAWHQFHGTPGEPVQARATLKWLMGDTVELDVVGVARLAGVDLLDNNRELFITGKDGANVKVHPDGMVRTVEGRTTHYYYHYNFECKSCDTYTFDAWLANGGPDDKWGYLTQASVEVAAWREAGYNVNETCFVAVSTGSRQGSIAEWLLPYDQKLVDAWHERRMQARADVKPKVPFEAEPEMEYHAGKACSADWFVHGEPRPRLNTKGATYGWDVPTGRKILPTVCGYCAYKQSCWTGAEMDVVSGKPVWVVK
jgi:hypothetical protein